MRALLVTLVTLVTVVPLAAHADDSLLERPRARQGYYATLGLRGTMAFVHEDDDTFGPLGGTAYAITLGQLIDSRYGLGISIDFGGASGDRQTQSFGGLAVAGQIPLVHDLALHGAVGLGIIVLSSPDDLPDESRGVYGATYTLGLSYDWFFTNRRSGGWSLTPSLELRTLPGDTQSYSAFLGLSISWWSGLPKNQLELAPDEAFR